MRTAWGGAGCSRRRAKIGFGGRPTIRRLLLRDARPRPGGRGRDRADPGPDRAHEHGRAAAPRRARRARAVQPRHHLHRLFRARRDRPHPAVRRHPARAHRRRLGAPSRLASSSGSRRSTCFLGDVYHDQQILKDGVVPADLVLGNANYRPRNDRAATCRTAPTSTSAASTSCATRTAASWCWRTTRARRPASPTSSRTAT